jgi:hypothetical protein
MSVIGRCDKVIRDCKDCRYFRERKQGVIGAETDQCGHMETMIHKDPPFTYRTTSPYDIPYWCPLPLAVRRHKI